MVGQKVQLHEHYFPSVYMKTGAPIGTVALSSGYEATGASMSQKLAVMMYIINYEELRHLLNVKAPARILKASCLSGNQSG